MDVLVALQRWVYGSIGGELNSFAATRDWLTLAGLFPLGVVFGAIHALTPGHGKTVLASYLIGSRLAPLRGALVAAALSLTHVASAVVLALFAAPLVTRTLGGGGQAPTLEFLSRGMLALIGAWLFYRALCKPAPHVRHEGVTVGIVTGLIPCPLTLFVMFFALARGVVEAGLTFAVAMAIGIAATLAAVAVLSIVARDFLVGFLTRHGESFARMMRILDATSGLLLIVIGVAMLARLSA